MRYLKQDRIDKAKGFWSCDNCSRDICWDNRVHGWVHASTLSKRCIFEAKPKQRVIDLVAANIARP